VSTKAKRKLRARKQELAELAKKKKGERPWTTNYIFPVMALDRVSNFMSQVYNGSQVLPLTIQHPTGDVEQATGVLSYFKNLTGTLFETPPEFRGWTFYILSKVAEGFDYFQFHPLAVVRWGNYVMYAPWANPHLPKFYRAKCKEMFPSKAYVFEMDGINGDQTNDHKYFVAALGGNGRSTGSTKVKLDPVEGAANWEKQQTGVILSIVEEYAKSAWSSQVLVVVAKPVKDSTDADVYRIRPTRENLEKAFADGGTPFGLIHFVMEDGKFGAKGDRLFPPGMEHKSEWFDNALKVTMDDIAVEAKEWLKAQATPERI